MAAAIPAEAKAGFSVVRGSSPIRSMAPPVCRWRRWWRVRVHCPSAIPFGRLHG